MAKAGVREGTIGRGLRVALAVVLVVPLRVELRVGLVVAVGMKVLEIDELRSVDAVEVNETVVDPLDAVVGVESELLVDAAWVEVGVLENGVDDGALSRCSNAAAVRGMRCAHVRATKRLARKM